MRHRFDRFYRHNSVLYSCYLLPARFLERETDTARDTRSTDVSPRPKRFSPDFDKQLKSKQQFHCDPRAPCITRACIHARATIGKPEAVRAIVTRTAFPVNGGEGGFRRNPGSAGERVWSVGRSGPKNASKQAGLKWHPLVAEICMSWPKLRYNYAAYII